jgi:hypothetical protein
MGIKNPTKPDKTRQSLFVKVIFWVEAGIIGGQNEISLLVINELSFKSDAHPSGLSHSGVASSRSLLAMTRGKEKGNSFFLGWIFRSKNQEPRTKRPRGG